MHGFNSIFFITQHQTAFLLLAEEFPHCDQTIAVYLFSNDGVSTRTDHYFKCFCNQAWYMACHYRLTMKARLPDCKLRTFRNMVTWDVCSFISTRQQLMAICWYAVIDGTTELDLDLHFYVFVWNLKSRYDKKRHYNIEVVTYAFASFFARENTLNYCSRILDLPLT